MSAPTPLPEHVLAATRRRTLTVPAGGRRLRLETAHGLFAADAVDDGTALLLAHLPGGEPRAVLDLGCGYGALGLPVAATHPDAAVTLVDRDLLAVAYASHNAARNGLRRVSAEGGLDYRDLEPASRFDWILCNVPARIGARAIAHVLGAGVRRLRAGGELRTVVITDLAATVAAGAAARGLTLVEVARGRRHVVHACAASDDAGGAATAPGVAHDETSDGARDDATVYARDEVVVDGRPLVRPHDLGEDRAHLEVGVPLLLGLLPRRPAGRRCLVVRPWYGGVAVALAARGAEVHAVDRDLLALLATRSNAARHGVSVGTGAGPWLPDAVGAAGPVERAARFDLIVGELSSSSGEEVARRELTSTRRWLAPGGEALWLLGDRLATSVVRGLEDARVRAPREIARRDGFVVLRDVAGAAP